MDYHASNIYDFMHNLPVEGYVNGIDAVTLTATGLEGKIAVSYIIHALEDKLVLEKGKPFRFQGASGWVKGSVRYAEKFDGRGQKEWCILMVTGQLSAQVFKAAIALKEVKLTRVDLACDIVMRERVLGLARMLKDTYKGKSSIKLIESLTGDTFYCGSRQSEEMIRIYDKSPEYNEEMGMVWRFEVEYKKGIAKLIPDALQELGTDGIKDLIFQSCRDKDLPAPIPGKMVKIARSAVTMSSSEMKINWLSRQVLPTVTWLKSLGLKEEVVKALQLELPIS